YCSYYASYPSADSYLGWQPRTDPGASASSYQAARRAFQKGDYAFSQMECERAIRLLPGDATSHKLLTLCQFAQGKYRDAAASLYEVLAAGHGWGWDTVSSFYTGTRTYTTQLRALERYVRENPNDAAGRFVLAYHYLALNERDAAHDQLRAAIRLLPRDPGAPGILEGLGQAQEGQNRAAPL